VRENEKDEVRVPVHVQGENEEKEEDKEWGLFELHRLCLTDSRKRHKFFLVACCAHSSQIPGAWRQAAG